MMMLRRLAVHSSTFITASVFHTAEKIHIPIFGKQPLPSQTFLRTFLGLHQFVNKEAIQKERARIKDELSRGYFADIAEIHKNNGKIASANKTIIPSLAAIEFPELQVNFSDGRCMKLPTTPEQPVAETSQMPDPCVSLLCLSFRANSQKMAESWTLPVLDSFGGAGSVQIYEVSFVDSWLFSLGPARRIFLKMVRKSNNPQRQIVYSFGDHYYFRKKLQIVNLLTGYIFLLDRLGRIRWQGFGYATEEELSWLLSCTSNLLDEK
ncbi:hypothetical protein Cni_G02639 [Canna indica]|uniref:AT1G08220-like protein n=1 Tax=Canna indica TaxID=4628 RepID=A0AAQ3Q0G1_9LILI|nr:hypothetical protein Cni_G02639 [Canna indica]